MKIDRTIPYVDFYMRRPPMEAPKVSALPEGYGFAFYESGDMRAWAEIETSVDEFDDISGAEDYFKRDFLPYEKLLFDRMLFVTAPDGKKIATATAFFMEHDGIRTPFLHWVAVMPEHQSKGVGRALITRTAALLCELNGETEMWLHTQVNSHRAVAIYESVGFEMSLLSPGVWANSITAEQLKFAKAILDAKRASSGGGIMRYEVITTDKPDFSNANTAAIANYKWLKGYAPAAKAKLIFVEGGGIAVRMECDEEKPRATYRNFYDEVYKDSCLEFFFGFVKGGAYVNCEMNSLGTCLIQYGEGRSNRVRIDKLITPPKVSAGRDGKTWSVEVMFTLEQIHKIFGNVEITRGTVFYGNFYKCGDDTETPHYGMWAEVGTETPDFHRPEYFGELVIV